MAHLIVGLMLTNPMHRTENQAHVPYQTPLQNVYIILIYAKYAVPRVKPLTLPRPRPNRLTIMAKKFEAWVQPVGIRAQSKSSSLQAGRARAIPTHDHF